MKITIELNDTDHEDKNKLSLFLTSEEMLDSLREIYDFLSEKVSLETESKVYGEVLNYFKSILSSHSINIC